MFLSERSRDLIWRFASNGTIIFHPQKTGGAFLKGVYKTEYGKGYCNLQKLNLWGAEYAKYGAFHQEIEDFNSHVESGKLWSIGFPHQALNLSELKDIPFNVKIIMTYREIRPRVYSGIRYIYTRIKDLQNAQIKLTANGNQILHPTKNSWGGIEGIYSNIEKSPEGYAINNLTIELSLIFARMISYSQVFIDKFESGDFNDLYAGLIKEKFTFTETLDDLLLSNKLSKAHLDRITFIHTNDLDNYCNSLFNKIFPRVNESKNDSVPSNLLNFLSSKKLNETIDLLELQESKTEKLLQSMLWKPN